MVPLAQLTRRRQAILERCAAQRATVAAAAGSLQEASATPMMLALGAAGAVLAVSPRLRRWTSRALAAYMLLRRL
jgi:hypothetical protein